MSVFAGRFEGVGGLGPIRGVAVGEGRGVGLRDGEDDGVADGEGAGVVVGLGLGVAVGVGTLTFVFRLSGGIVIFAFVGGALKLKFESKPTFALRLTF